MKSNFGFIRDELDIKILILFVLSRLPDPVSLDVLTDLAMCDDGIVYFDFMECVKGLLRTEHIQCVGDKYSLTDKGARNGSITEERLPFIVKMNAENSTFAYRSKENRNAMINTSHTTNQDGTRSVKLSLSDGFGDIVSIALIAPNEQQALNLEKGFRKNAESIHNELVDIILN